MAALRVLNVWEKMEDNKITAEYVLQAKQRAQAALNDIYSLTSAEPVSSGVKKTVSAYYNAEYKKALFATPVSAVNDPYKGVYVSFLSAMGYNNLGDLMQMTLDDLMDTPGIGMENAKAIFAALDRIRAETYSCKIVPVDTPEGRSLAFEYHKYRNLSILYSGAQERYGACRDELAGLYDQLSGLASEKGWAVMTKGRKEKLAAAASRINEVITDELAAGISDDLKMRAMILNTSEEDAWTAYLNEKGIYLEGIQEFGKK